MDCCGCDLLETVNTLLLWNDTYQVYLVVRIGWLMPTARTLIFIIKLRSYTGIPNR